MHHPGRRRIEGRRKHGLVAGQSPESQACDKIGNCARGREAERRYATRHAQQRPEAGWTEEIGEIMRYVVILEEGPEGWGAYVPDLPVCVAAGETRQETLDLIREAIEFHLDGMKERGDLMPEPHSHTEGVQVNAA